MARVALEHVEKVFPGGTRAVADLTLAVEDGELLVLVGPSGCGKSTVLRLVAGLEAASTGVVRIGDRVVNDVRPQDRNVAMVFQDYALYPHLSARRNLEFPLRMRRLGRDEIARRVERVAGVLDIAHLLERLPKALSGGQRQRVAMGRALVRDPAAFLLDEPLSNLDARLRTQVRADIKAIQARTGTTMLYVTHDQTEAMTLGHRVAVLHRGRLQQVASPDALYARPANVVVAGFIGSPPMNLVPAGVLTADRGAAVTAGIRPEAITLATGTPLPRDAVPATVAHVECLGHETLVHVDVRPDGAPATAVVVRVAGMPSLAQGAAVGLRIPPDAVHRFDADGVRVD